MFSFEQTVNGEIYRFSENAKGEIEITRVIDRISPIGAYHDLAEQQKPEFPQDPEPNEYRYIDPAWIDAVATGLTAGAKKHPKKTWKKIPAREHAARAIRHLFLFCKGDQSDDHLINASMRCMMASVLAMAAKAEAAED